MEISQSSDVPMAMAGFWCWRSIEKVAREALLSYSRDVMVWVGEGFRLNLDGGWSSSRHGLLVEIKLGSCERSMMGEDGVARLVHRLS